MGCTAHEMHRAYFTLYRYFAQQEHETLLDAAQRYLMSHEHDLIALVSIFALTNFGKSKTWWPGLVAAAHRVDQRDLTHSSGAPYTMAELPASRSVFPGTLTRRSFSSTGRSPSLPPTAPRSTCR